MVDAFKETISRIETVMWSTITLSILLLFLDPTKEEITVLGIPINPSRAFIIIPISIIGLLIARRILIKNAVFIIKTASSKSDAPKTLTKLRKIVIYHPIPEFIYYKMPEFKQYKSQGCSFVFEGLILAVFLYLYEVIPAFALAISWLYHLNPQSIYSNVPGISAIIVLILGTWNTKIMEKQIYEPLKKVNSTPN